MNRTLTSVLRTKQAQNLIDAGFKLASTDRQLANGTLAFTKRIGKKTAKYAVTGTGAVISNEFVARQVFGETESQLYREGLMAIGDLYAKRVTR